MSTKTSKQNTGLLLINLGSPQAPTAAAVGPYLTQFLTDRYVIDLPYLLRQALVRAVIVPFRKHKSAEAYQKIWRPEGSPLVHFTRQFAQKVATQVPYDVRWAMRYGAPSVASTLQDWKVDKIDVDKIYIVPLYPQYAESSTQTAVDEALTEAGRLGLKAEVVFQDFFVAPEFIEASVRQIQKAQTSFRPDHLMLSFHGLPEHHLNKLHPEVCHQDKACCAQVTTENRKCYRAQSLATARAIQSHLEFAAQDVTVSFQSRLGRRPWIQPFTDIEITRLAERGVKRVLVSCPSFVADCLETLEEIEIRLRAQFRAEGGEDLALVPSLNDEDFWVSGFSAMVQNAISNLR